MYGGISVRIKKYIILLLTTALTITTIFTVGFCIKTATPVVDIFKVTKSKSDEIVQSTGKIGYINQKNVKSDCNCVVIDILTKENDKVNKNDELIKVAIIELPSNLDMNNISKIIDTYKNYDISKAEYKIITAPESGTITSLRVQKGDIVTKGSELLTITDKSGLSVKLNINETQISKIKEGQEVTITGSAFDKKSYIGKVISISDEAEETTNETGRETTVEVDVKVENPDEEIKRGYTAKCAIITASDNSSIIIPYESLGSDNEGDYVYKFQNGRAEKQYVSIESELTIGAKIKDGIKNGDSIIKNISELSDGEAQAIHIESE